MLTVACGVCTYWLIWTIFPAVGWWTAILTTWVLALGVLRTFGSVRLPAVPPLLVLLALLVGSLYLAGEIGPLAGVWLPIPCLGAALAGSSDDLWRSAKHWARPALRFVQITGSALLIVSAVGSYATARRVGPLERVLRTQHTPAADLEISRLVASGATACEALQSIAHAVATGRAFDRSLAGTVAVCPASAEAAFLDRESSAAPETDSRRRRLLREARDQLSRPPESAAKRP